MRNIVIWSVLAILALGWTVLLAMAVAELRRLRRAVEAGSAARDGQVVHAAHATGGVGPIG